MSSTLIYPIYHLILSEDLVRKSNYYTLPDPIEHKGVILFNGVTVILFYTTSCGYCTRFKPVYQQLANHIHQQDPSVTFTCVELGVDEDEQRILPKFVGDFESVPTIFAIVKGKVHKYGGDRSYNDLYRWIISRR